MKIAAFPSLLRLMLFGFLLILLPLVASIVTAISQVERLAEGSLTSIMAVQGGTSASRLLEERTTSIERSARQYLVLKDPLFKTYFQQHRHAALTQLNRLNAETGSPTLGRAVAEARVALARVDKLVGGVGDSTTGADLNEALGDLRGATETILKEQNKVSRELALAFPRDALELRQTLITWAALVIPISAGLALLFGAVIARPIRAIGQAISALGRNELGHEVHIHGTEDLQQLGRRLEWLRLRLLELEAQKAQFLRNVSHELKTPLTNIREGADLLAGDRATGATGEMREVAEIVRENSLRLQRMIEELLRYGSESDMSADAPNEPVRLDQLVLEVLEAHQSPANRRAVTIRHSLQPVTLAGNAKRLRVIIANLLSNAMKYAPDGGHIEVRLEAGSAAVRLDVLDDGPGVSEEDQPHLFEWFHTGAKPPDAVVAGTGMGLAITKEYVERLGGRIKYLASAKGAHFRVTFQKVGQ